MTTKAHQSQAPSLPFGGVAGGFFNTASKAVTNAINRHRQNVFNQQVWQHDFEVMNHQQSYNIAAMASQREYDSPLEQKKRLMQAGINAFTANDMITNDTGIIQHPLNTQNSPIQFRETNFDMSSLFDALQTYAQMKENRNLTKIQQEHAERLIDKQLTHSEQLADLNNIRERTLTFDKMIHELNMLQYNRDSDIINREDSQAHDLQIQANQNRWQSNENSLNRDFSESESGFDRQFRLIQQQEQSRLAEDLEKLRIESNERMQKANLDFQTKKEEVEFDKWKHPFVDDKSPWWFNKVAGERNTSYPLHERDIRNPWKLPYTHRF